MRALRRFRAGYRLVCMFLYLTGEMVIVSRRRECLLYGVHLRGVANAWIAYVPCSKRCLEVKWIV